MVIFIYRIVSLFSGAGGMDLGFINAGFNVIWANDFEKSQVETYKHNIGSHIVLGDITQIRSDNIPECDIIIGGSPCQGFSNANRRTGFLNNPKNFLVREFIRVVKDKRPQVFVLENVPQLLTAGDGQFLKEIKIALKEYQITEKVLNSADYGVPQLRKRTIVIGCKSGMIVHPLSTVSHYNTVKDALLNIDDSIPNQSDKTIHSTLVIKRIKSLIQGQNIFDIPEEIRPKGGQSCSYKRLEIDKPSITMGNFRKNLILHPYEDRALSVREAARIQTFPDDFVFLGTLSDKQQMVANAVPPLMAEAIADTIMIHMNKMNSQAS